jgi:hypothetical protein
MNSTWFLRSDGAAQVFSCKVGCLQRYRYLVTLMFLLTMIGVVAEYSMAGIDANSQLADSALRLYRTHDNLCGPIACYVLLGSLGQHPQFDMIVKRMDPGTRGVSMESILEIIKEQGLSAIPVQMSESELTKVLSEHADLACIALIRGDHWVCVGISGNGELKYFDYPSWRNVGSVDAPKFDGQCARRFGDSCSIVIASTFNRKVFHHRAHMCGRVVDHRLDPRSFVPAPITATLRF